MNENKRNILKRLIEILREEEEKNSIKLLDAIESYCTTDVGEYRFGVMVFVLKKVVDLL